MSDLPVIVHPETFVKTRGGEVVEDELERVTRLLRGCYDCIYSDFANYINSYYGSMTLVRNYGKYPEDKAAEHAKKYYPILAEAREYLGIEETDSQKRMGRNREEDE